MRVSQQTVPIFFLFTTIKCVLMTGRKAFGRRRRENGGKKRFLGNNWGGQWAEMIAGLRHR
jgi:hypothetical protein